MEGKSLRDPGISKDKLCGILQKILDSGMQCDCSLSLLWKGRMQRYGIRAPPSGRAMTMFYTQHFLKDSYFDPI